MGQTTKPAFIQLSAQDRIPILYGFGETGPLGLRAAGIAYRDPFTRKPIGIRAPLEEFPRDFGFDPKVYALRFESAGFNR